MQLAPDAKVIARLQKILALANDGRGNEAEANVAMQRAQELMAEYNLSMATVEAHGGQSESRLNEKTDHKLMFLWQQTLFPACAEAAFCHFSMVDKPTLGGQYIKGGYQIIGRQSNVIAARQMYEYLRDTIQQVVREEVGRSSSDQFSKTANSFRIGMAERLAERLKGRHEAKLEQQAREAREKQARNNHPAAAKTDPNFHAPTVTLADFAASEEDLNNDMHHGWKPGTTAARRAKQEAEDAMRSVRWAAEDARRAALKKAALDAGHSNEVAHYMSHGLTLENAMALVARDNKERKPETEAAGRRRKKRNDRYWKNQEKRERAKEEREARKYDQDALARGRERAESVGLDDQIGNKGTKRLA